ncbi:MAG: hypothetical protein ABIQ62_01195 [Thermomonas sp.]
MPCPICQCAELHPAHNILAVLPSNDLDEALEHGLIDALPCPGCSAPCTTMLCTAQAARISALAARERHLARGKRLQRRKAERDAARVPKASTAAPPALPAAAADVLARALAKARTPK